MVQDILDVVRHGLGRGARRLVRWATSRPTARFGLHGLAILVTLGAAALVGGYVVPAATANSGPARQGRPTQQPPPSDGALQPGGGSASPAPSGHPSASASPGAGSGPASLSGWASSVAPKLGIPPVALQAYGYAELVAAKTEPACHLTWTTLAGIGKIESDHGRENHSVLQPDGTSQPPIIGVALDGTSGNKVVRDTDHGVLDHDTVYDRAIGPMQFLPGTWASWGTDANGDGKADPFNVNDATLAAARYLCADGHDLGTGAGWWQAIHAYNNLDKYASDVFAAADDYGRRSRP